jgi:hypothetical protein
MPLSFDKRNSRRLHLTRPAAAFLSGRKVSILNISEKGVGIEHDFPLVAGRSVRLEFYWGKQRLYLTCEIVRTKEKKGAKPIPVWISGLEFRDETEESVPRLRTLVREARKKMEQASEPMLTEE